MLDGNNITRDHIILRELSHPVNQPYDSTHARRDRNRLYNLGIFEWVELYPRETLPGEAALVVEVVETIRMVPIPLIYFLEELGWSYGGGLSYLNFRGLNQRLDLTTTFGAEKTYTVLFSDPWLLGDRISVIGWLMQIYRGHPVHNFRMQIRDVEVGMGKMSRLKTVGVRAAVSLERRRIHWLEAGRQDTLHKVFQSKLDFVWRTTDVWRDPTRGFQINVYLSPVRAMDRRSPSYTVMRIRGAWFYPLRRGSFPLVFGVGAGISHYEHHDRQRPLYVRQYVGGYWVRGYDADPKANPADLPGLQVATSVATASIELRQTLLPRRLLGRLELGLSGLLFLDAGWGYGPGQRLMQARPLIGYGIGLRLFLPIIQVLALDFGINPFSTCIRPRLRISQAF